MTKAPSLTLGIEEEFQIVDPVTGELRSYITQILEDDRVTVKDIKPELHQSVVEVGSCICQTPADVRREMIRLRRMVSELAGRDGLAIMSSGTHPFASWLDQEITPLVRYLGIEEDLQELARRNLIFGFHVHVGIEDRDFLIDVMRAVRSFMPHVLALSTSSPFWMGRSTGLKSYRSVVWRKFPRTGTPPDFATWADYERLVDTLVRAHSLEDPSKIWWDVRPSGFYPTLEFRISDMCTRVDEAVCIVAIIQALVAKLWKLRRDNLTLRTYPLSLLSENKWRVVRYGLDGKLIHLGREQEVPVRTAIGEMLEFLDDVVDELGTRGEVEYAQTILEGGSSADRQLRVYGETGDPIAVVQHLIRETSEGCCDEPRLPHPPERSPKSSGAPRRRARADSARQG